MDEHLFFSPHIGTVPIDLYFDSVVWIIIVPIVPFDFKTAQARRILSFTINRIIIITILQQMIFD